MGEFDFDYFVIGAGSGGVRSARMAASFGAKVAIAEARHMGGTCVNVGCVPKKLLVYASQFSQEAADAAGFGWTVPNTAFDWPTLIENKNREISRLNGVYEKLLNDACVSIFEGKASLADAHTVEINGKTHTSRYILIATGSAPHVPDFPGREHVVTSDEAFFLKQLPKRILIVGGGYIAVEFAGIFHGMGAAVTQIYRGPLFLRGFDDDVRQALADAMRARGVDLRFDLNVERIEKRGAAYIATLTDDSTVEADLVMFATGRRPNIASLGLDRIDVEVDRNGAVMVDAYSKTSVENIYAVGDVTDRVMLTPVAIAEGAAVARTLFNDEPTPMDYHNIPSAVFAQPPIGTVGLTERRAREEYERVDVYRSTFRPMKNTLAGRDEKVMMKLIVDRETDRVLGVHMVGPDAGEIVQGMAIALQCGATKAQFDATLGIHPTSAEEFVTMRQKV